MIAQEDFRRAQMLQVNKTSEVVIKLNELHKDMISLEKSISKSTLKLNKREYELRSEMQETYNQEFSKKKEKIKRLKEKLQRKKCELQSAQKEFQTRQEELLQARIELKKQHEDVMQLQREKKELACHYNIEREQVSKLVQLLVSDKKEMQVRVMCSHYSVSFLTIFFFLRLEVLAEATLMPVPVFTLCVNA